MRQTLKWNEENSVCVLHSLLLEQDYLTQDQIIELTGLSRTAVSETLKILIDNTSLPILQTRKPDSKKNYYYCPFSFDQYVKYYLLQSIQLTISNLKAIPIFLFRLESIKEDSIEKKHLEKYLRVNLLITYYYNELADDINTIWEKFQENPNFKLTLTNELKGSNLDIENLVKETTKDMQPVEADTLIKIKHDFVKYSMETQTAYGRSRELTSISHALVIEPNSVTQDYLIEFTKYGRSTVSEALTKLVKLDSVEIVKKSKDRKKYYKTKYSLIDYVIIRTKASIRTIEGIIMILNENFIRRAHSLSVDVKIKNKYIDFFNINIKSYKRFSNIIEIYFTTIFDKLEIFL